MNMNELKLRLLEGNLFEDDEDLQQGQPDDFGDARNQPGMDQIDQTHFKDVRKPKLTLQALGQLRKIRELKKAEYARKKELYQIMYKVPEEESTPAM